MSVQGNARTFMASWHSSLTASSYIEPGANPANSARGSATASALADRRVLADRLEKLLIIEIVQWYGKPVAEEFHETTAEVGVMLLRHTFDKMGRAGTSQSTISLVARTGVNMM